VPLAAFVTARGRLPEASELEMAPQIHEVMGSLRHAFAIIQRVTGADQWNRIRETRVQDLLIYLALARFDGRPRFSDLPRVLQLDVRALFSSYRRACTLADDLLFSTGNLQAIDAACRTAGVGKLTPDALYIHTSALSQTPAHPANLRRLRPDLYRPCRGRQSHRRYPGRRRHEGSNLPAWRGLAATVIATVRSGVRAANNNTANSNSSAVGGSRVASADPGSSHR
jgi:hypothetical protein